MVYFHVGNLRRRLQKEKKSNDHPIGNKFEYMDQGKFYIAIVKLGKHSPNLSIDDRFGFGCLKF